MLNELKVIELLQQNDKQAIEWLYDHYGAALYGIVLKIVQSEEVAEDLLQETFVKVWKNGHKYEASKGTLFTWMLNIARNTAIDKQRSAGFRKQQMIHSLDPSVYNKEETNKSFDPNTMGLRKWVGNLDEKYRQVIDLVYFQGFTQKEVEEHLGIPLGTVKSRLRIGLRELRNVFDDSNLILYFILFQMLVY